MASVEQMKRALETEQERFVELSSKALTAIDAVTGQANFWLTALTAIIAIVALIGLGAVFYSTQKTAAKVANSRLNTYIQSAEWKGEVEKLIREEIQSQLDERLFSKVTPAEQTDGEPSFPKAPEKGGKR